MFENICERIIGWISLLIKITQAAVIGKSLWFNTIGMFLAHTKSKLNVFGWLSMLWFSDSGLFHPMALPSPSRPWSPAISARKWRVVGRPICYLTTSAWKWLTLAQVLRVRTSDTATSQYKGPGSGKCFPKTTRHQERRHAPLVDSWPSLPQEGNENHVSCVAFYPLSCISFCSSEISTNYRCICWMNLKTAEL